MYTIIIKNPLSDTKNTSLNILDTLSFRFSNLRPISMKRELSIRSQVIAIDIIASIASHHKRNLYSNERNIIKNNSTMKERIPTAICPHVKQSRNDIPTNLLSEATKELCSSFATLLTIIKHIGPNIPINIVAKAKQYVGSVNERKIYVNNIQYLHIIIPTTGIVISISFMFILTPK